MEYEIHITVKNPNVLLFINDCQILGVKPIIIETEKEEVFNNQVMTSSKYKDDNYTETLNKLSKSLIDKGYHLLRQKVEIRPLSIKHKNHIYYESHLRLKLSKEFNRNVLIDLCKNHNFHLSKNLFKKTIDFNYQMITYRNYNISFDGFNQVIDKMKSELNNLNIAFDKVEIEECIVDSNISVDKHWI